METLKIVQFFAKILEQSKKTFKILVRTIGFKNVTKSDVRSKKSVLTKEKIFEELQMETAKCQLLETLATNMKANKQPALIKQHENGVNQAKK